MSPAPESDKRVVREQPGPEIVAEVTVSTATAIVCSADDPYRVLVAKSAKHPFPVLPGGKLEAIDLTGASEEQAALCCVLREVTEELGTELLDARAIGKASDPDRDIRLVPVSKLSGAVVSPALDESLDASATVKAHYGCPDYIFVGYVDESAIRATEELDDQHFVDIRTLGPGDLSAGHDVVVLAYRAMLDRGESALPKDALRDFASERERLT